MATIEVVYIPLSQSALHVNLEFAAGMTVANALEQSGLLKLYPELTTMSIGIFARIVSLDTVLKPGDRVEVYRPLLISPMEKRRQRAKQK